MTYRTEWQDGFGARGWKLDFATNDPMVIACTAYTGEKSPTSVLVHDILDHFVSGFPPSGYLNEARATALHGLRNGLEVHSSYESMVDEILGSKGLEEPVDEFLPPFLIAEVPKEIIANDEKFACLLEKYGAEYLRQAMLKYFFQIGLSGIPMAMDNWRKHRIEFGKMNSMGRCIQCLLEDAEKIIAEWDVESARGRIVIGNDTCEFSIGSQDGSKKDRIIKSV